MESNQVIWEHGIIMVIGLGFVGNDLKILINPNYTFGFKFRFKKISPKTFFPKEFLTFLLNSIGF